ncbi:MAG: hypothetical protein IKJ98_04785 [Bacteroidales bacterium]|nr:hypothetical protein [Bacteroidales bacterium]
MEQEHKYYPSLIGNIVLLLFLPFFAEAQKEYICIDPSEDDEPVYVERVEKKPAYPGGDEELFKPKIRNYHPIHD